MTHLKHRLTALLRRTERYTKTDMVYLFKSGGWLALGQGAALVFSLGLAVIFGHYATQDTYGNYKYILSLASVLGVFSLSGISTAVTRSIARGYDGALNQGLVLSLRWSGGILITGSVIGVYYWLQGNYFVATALLIAALAVPFINGFSLYDAYLTGHKNFRTNVLFYTGSLGFTTIALVTTLLFFSQRAIILVVVYFLTNVISDVILYFVTLRQAKNDQKDPELEHYSKHLSIINLIDVVAEKIDSIIVFILLGPIQLAVYAYAIAVPEQFRNATKSLTSLSFAKFASRPIREIRQNMRPRIVFLAGISGALMLVYITLSPVLFHYLFPIYIESVPYSQWYALIMIPTAVATVFITILQAHRKTQSLYIATAAGQILLIVLLPILTYFAGIVGAIISQLVYRFVVLLLSLWQFAIATDTPVQTQ